MLSFKLCQALYDVQYRSEISGLRTRKTQAQFLRKRVLKNACLNTHLRAFDARVPFVIHPHLRHSSPFSLNKRHVFWAQYLRPVLYFTINIYITIQAKLPLTVPKYFAIHLF